MVRRTHPTGPHLPLSPLSRITRKSWALVRMARAAREPRLASFSAATSLISTCVNLDQPHLSARQDPVHGDEIPGGDAV